MDIFEHVKLFEPIPIGLNESSAILTVLEKTLQSVKLCSVVVAVNLVHASVLMSEVATASIAAYFLFVEGSAIFSSQFVVWCKV